MNALPTMAAAPRHAQILLDLSLVAVTPGTHLTMMEQLAMASYNKACLQGQVHVCMCEYKFDSLLRCGRVHCGYRQLSAQLCEHCGLILLYM